MINHQVLQAAGEADVHISKNSMSNIVLSNDSDFFFHRNVDVVLRPKLKKGELLCTRITRKEIQTQLEISESQLRALGVISGNDYDDNIPTFGIRSNLKILKELGESGKDAATLVESYIEEMNHCGYASPTFDPAKSIFIEGKETLLDEEPREDVQVVVSLLAEGKRIIEERKVKKMEGLLNSEFKPKWTSNTFRPLARSGTERYSFKTVDIKKKCKSDVPKVISDSL